MRRLWIASLCLYLTPLSARPCGNYISDVFSGDKVIGFELSNSLNSTKGKKIVIDDDGILSAGVIAAYCNKGFEVKVNNVDLTSEQTYCANKAIRGAKILISVGGGFLPKESAIVKSSCGFDLDELYKTKPEYGSRPVICATKVKDFIKKIYIRYEAFKKTELDPANWDKKSLPQSEKDAIAETIEMNSKALKEMTRIMNLNPLTRKDFDPWIEQFSKGVSRESFLVVDSMSDLDSPDRKLQPAPSVLSDLGGELPGWDGPHCPFNIEDSSIDSLVKADWLSSGANPQSGVKNKTSQ